MAIKNSQEFEVVLRVRDETTDHYKRAEKYAKDYANTVGSVNVSLMGSFQNLAIAITGVNQALEIAGKMYRAISTPIRDAVNAFREQDKAENRLITTLKSLNSYNETTLKYFKDYATQLQNTTSLTDDMVLKFVSLAKQSGISNERTKQLIEASAGLATVMDGDVSSAFRDLLGQYTGVTGRASKYVDGLKELNEQQLRAGKGVELVAAKFSRFAKDEVESLDGRLNQLHKTWEDLYETFGGIISRFVDLPGRITQLTNMLHILNEAIQNSEKYFNKLKAAIEAVDWQKIAQGVAIAVGAIAAFSLASFTAEIYLAIKAIGGFNAALSAMGGLRVVLQQMIAAMNVGPLLQFAKVQGLIALKFMATAVALGFVVSAIDILIRNYDRLDKVARIVGNSFLVIFNKMFQGLVFLDAKWQDFLLNIMIGLNKVGSISDKLLDEQYKRAQSSGQMRIDLLMKQISLVDKISKDSEGIDFGIAGEGMKLFKSLMSDGNKELDTMLKNVESVNDPMKDLNALSKEQLALMRQIKLENADIGTNIANVFSDEIEKQAELLAQTLRHIEARKEELKIAGMLTPEIEAALAKQAELQRKLSEKMILSIEFEIAKQNANPIAAGIGDAFARGANAMLPILSKGIDYFNNAFAGVLGFELSKLSQEDVLGIATSLTKLTGSLQGFFEESNALFGRGLVEGASLVTKGINAAFGTNIPEMSQGMKDGIVEGARMLGKTMGAVFSLAYDVAAKLFDPEWINSIGDKLNNFIAKLPEALSKAWEGLSRAFAKFIEKLPEVVEKLISIVSKAIASSVPSIVGSIDGIFAAINTLVDGLPYLFTQILDGAINVAEKILDNLPETIEKMFSAAGKITAYLISKLPEIMEKLFASLPDIIESIIVGIFDSMGSIVAALIDLIAGGGMERIIGAFLRMIPRLVVAFVNGVIRGLSAFFANIWKGVQIPDSLADLPNNIAEGAKSLGKDISREASQLFKVANLEEAFGGIDPSKSFKESIDGINNSLRRNILGLWDYLKKAWRWIDEKIIQPMIKAIYAVWTWINDTIIQPMLEGIRVVWTWVSDYIVTPLTEGLQVVWRWVYDYVVLGLANSLRNAWGTVIGFFQNVFKEKISEAFAGVIAFFRTELFGRISSAFAPLMSFLGKFNFSGAFSSIKNYLNKFSFPTIRTPGWLQGFIDAIAKLFKTPGWVKDLQKLNIGGSGGGGGGGGGAVGKVLSAANPANWSQGGMVTPLYAAEGMMVNWQPKGRDTVPAMLEPKEFVVNRRSTAANRGLLETINRAGGRKVTANSTGVTIGSVVINARTNLEPEAIRREILPELEKQIKRKSQDGKFVIAASGVRS